MTCRRRHSTRPITAVCYAAAVLFPVTATPVGGLAAAPPAAPAPEQEAGEHAAGDDSDTASAPVEPGDHGKDAGTDAEADPLIRQIFAVRDLVARGQRAAASARLQAMLDRYGSDPDVRAFAEEMGSLLEEPAPDLSTATAGGEVDAVVGDAPRRRVSLEELDDGDRVTARLLMKRNARLDEAEGNWEAEAANLLRDVKRLNVRQPDFAPGWLMQAELALLLDRPLEGWAAARNLLELGIEQTVDPDVLAVVAELEHRGWTPEPRTEVEGEAGEKAGDAGASEPAPGDEGGSEDGEPEDAELEGAEPDELGPAGRPRAEDDLRFEEEGASDP